MRREQPPDALADTLALIVADRIGRTPAVQRFRERALPGGDVLAPGAVSDWIAKTNDRETADLPAPRSPHDIPRGAVFTYRLPEDEDGCIRHLGVLPGGLLDELRGLGERLAPDMGRPGHDEEFPLIPTAWPPQDVVSVILTGIPPRFPIVQARALHHPTISTLDRLVLVIDPRTTPSDVAAIYGKLRAELAQARSGSARRIHHAHPLTVKHLALARLAATRESGQVSWRELLARWNSERPEWRYGEDQLTNFIRDARTAYQRVMGEPL